MLHLTRDAGRSWRDVTPPASAAMDGRFIRTAEPSPHDPGTLYLAATRYKLDDPAPYLFRTADYGESWDAIAGSGGDAAIPSDDFVRGDPGRSGVSWGAVRGNRDRGSTSRSTTARPGGRWRSNFPVTPVYDLKVEGTDLVIATHGRSFWIVDDLTPAAAGRLPGERRR